MKKQKAVVIAVTSDQHCGSTVAISPPKIELDDGGEYVASKAQRWLWEKWLDFWGKAQERRESLNADLYCVFNGDLTEGDHHGTTQILSGNPAAQASVVNACVAPILDLEPERLFFVRGTEAHVGKSAAFEERIASGLRKDKRPVVVDPDTGTSSWWHLRMDVQGVRLDFAHHGRFGQRPWTRGNVVLNLAAEIFYDHAADGEPHPHIAVRSHQHRYFDTASAHPTRVIQTPAWQLATAFIHRINPGALACIGGVLIVIQNGVPTVEPIIYKPERAKAWQPA
jgi:hypothetical protein